MRVTRQLAANKTRHQTLHDSYTSSSEDEIHPEQLPPVHRELPLDVLDPREPEESADDSHNEQSDGEHVARKCGRQQSDSDTESEGDVWDLIDNHITHSWLSGSESESEETVDVVKENLASWSTRFNIHQSATDNLLKLLKEHVPILGDLPSTARTLLKTPKHVDISCVSGMDYYHFGLRDQLINTLKLFPRTTVDQVDSLELVLTIDGLPLFRSSKTNVWPILCLVRNLHPHKVFPVTRSYQTFQPGLLE